MKPDKILAAIAKALVVLSVFLVLPASNVLLLMSPSFVIYEYSQPRVPGSEIYDPATRLKLSQETVQYLNTDAGIEALRDMRYNGQPVYNERELKHMADVKVVVVGLRWVWRAAAVIFLGALALVIRRSAWRRSFAHSAFLGSVLLVSMLAGIIIAALLSFDTFFVHFHQVFFEGETWLFNYTDSLIQFYPLQFWMDATYILGAATLIESLILGGLTLFWQTRCKPAGHAAETGA